MNEVPPSQRIPRQIIEDELYTAQAAALREELTARVLDEKLYPFLFIATRDPESLSPGRIGNTRLYLAHVDSNPPVRIWFQFDEEHVWLRSIERVPLGD